MKRKIKLRADGNSKIGFGHVMRLIALSEILGGDSFEFDFYSNDLGPQLEDAVSGIPSAHTNIHGDEGVFFKGLKKKDIVILDGYGFDEEYQKTIKSYGCKLVFVDDLHDRHYLADAIINHAGGAKRFMYKAAPYTNCYLGMVYGLLRKEFREASAFPREIVRLDRLFICFGGSSDGVDFAHKVAGYALKIDCFRELVVLFASAGEAEIFRRRIGSPKKSVNIVHGLQSNEVCRLLLSCDLAVVPSSNISMEACAAGVFLLTGMTADNQRDIYEGYAEMDFIYRIENFERFDFSAFQKSMSYFKELKLPFKINRPAIDSLAIRRIFNELSV